MTQPEMVPPLASTDQLQDRLGIDLTADPDIRRAEAALDDASALVRQIGNPSWGLTGAPGVVTPAAVVAAVLAAAARQYRNPEGLVSRTRGPFSDRVADGNTRGIFLTEEEEAVVRRNRDTARPSGLWTLATTRGDIGRAGDTVWLNDQYGAELFPT